MWESNGKYNPQVPCFVSVAPTRPANRYGMVQQSGFGSHARKPGYCVSEMIGSLRGIYHRVSAKYLPLYLHEFAFRFNNRDEFNLMDRVLETSF